MGGELELGEFADPFIGDGNQRATNDHMRYPFSRQDSLMSRTYHDGSMLESRSSALLENDFEGYNDFTSFPDTEPPVVNPGVSMETAYNHPSMGVNNFPPPHRPITNDNFTSQSNASPMNLFPTTTTSYSPHPRLDLPSQDAYNETLVSSGHPAIKASVVDPVINVVAPEEFLEPSQLQNESFPLYNAEGKPVEGSVSEFHHSSGGDSDSGRLNSGDGSSFSGGVGVVTPYGTPNSNSFAVPGTPLSIKTEISSDCSPLLSERFASPYDTKFDPFGEEGLSPLVEDGPGFLFDPSDPYSNSVDTTRYANVNSQSAYEAPRLDYSRNSDMRSNPDIQAHQYYPDSSDMPINTLQPPMSGHLLPTEKPHTGATLGVPRRKSRALSDSRTMRERAALLESLDHQSLLYQQKYGNRACTHSPVPHHPIDEVEQYPDLQFPSYMPMNIVPHASAPMPNDIHHNSRSNGLLSVPNTTRTRSVSSPFEPTADLKAAQMFSCELCGKRFTRAYNLRSHMRTHTDERPFACQHCGKAFARQHDRKRHEALHSGQKKFVCSGVAPGFQWGCQKRFARADALGRHFRTEAGKNCLRPLITEICANGSNRDTAPEGILYTGAINNQPQLSFADPDREPNSGMSVEEREDQTRRTVIITAVAEQLQDLLGGDKANNKT